MAERLVDLLPDAILRLDGDGRIIDANAGAAALTGYPVDTLVGSVCAELLDPQSLDGGSLLADGWHRSAQLRSVTAVPEQVVRLLRADGAETTVLVTGLYQRDPDGSVSGLTLALRGAGRRAHQAPTGIEIVSTVSHELRSPLTSVKGYTGLLLNRWDRLKDEQKREMLEQVNHDADRVKRLIDELLDISRLETGRLHLRRQMVDLAALVGSVVSKVAMEYPTLDVDVRIAENVPEVYADPDKLTQVLTNLVENACKYASPVGLEVTAELRGGDVAVAVTDRGEGIPVADLPKVFEKFFRRDLGRPTGSGLGLWISRGLVEAHGGRLTASSEDGRGTTFRFTVPIVSFDEVHAP
ncbi:MAG: PAS domain-containing sensor histidine kinase [Acidimicrobiales bacterium]